MGYWNDTRNVHSYIEQAEGYDGRALIARLREHVPSGASVLELGMGPGTDLDLLAETYTVTGSDISEVFLDRYREAHPGADLLLLDAVTIDTDRTFDCIYSNKVLMHLSRAECALSLSRQADLVPEGGWIMHSFWKGGGSEVQRGLLFTYYDEDSVQEVVDDRFEVIEIGHYEEISPDDSLYVLLRRRTSS